MTSIIYSKQLRSMQRDLYLQRYFSIVNKNIKWNKWLSKASVYILFHVREYVQSVK